MSTPENRLAARLDPIREALDKALEDAAGERMAFVLMIAPANRVGDHIVCSNIRENHVIVKFLRDAARTVKSRWTKCQAYAADMAKRGMN